MVAAMFMVLVLIWLPCSKAQSPVGEPTMSPPAVDCLTVLANISDCLSFVQAGSNLTVPDQACCPEFAGLLDRNPICLCQLLGNSESFGVDINRALMLPDACNLEILPLDSCPESVTASPLLSPLSPPAPPPPSPSHSLPPLPPPAPPPAQSPPPSPDKGSNTTRRVVIIVVSTVGGIILVVVFVCVFVYVRRKMKRKRTPPLDNLDGDINEISTPESLQYSFAVIRVATNGFSDDNKLGQGGFGSVYKGKLKNGREIAVKRFSQDSGQGEHEFKNEVLLLARLQHRNLVRLLGFSIKGSERLLMYEFVQNTSLDQFIFDPEKCIMLDWKRRYKIIRGIARGLLYLHEDSRLRIIHRDLKASNVLLDAEMNPKIADFGMARLFEPDKTWSSTSRIVGTYGYMAPEYLLHGQFSQKSDVFSFGVLVLEIITGQKNHSYHNGELIEDLLTNAWESWRRGAASSLIDVTMRDGSTFVQEMMRCIHIGLLCVQENLIDRPTMGTIVLMLSSSIILPIPSEPAFLKHTNYTTSEMLLEAYTYNMSDSRELKNKSISSQRSLASDTSMNDLYPCLDNDYLY